MPFTPDAIRAVRAVVDRSIGVVKAALEATNGDVAAAIDRLETPEERNARQKARIFSGRPARLDDPPPPPRPDPADERDVPRVLADFERAARARGFWIGTPDPSALAALRDPLPPAYVQFLERCNGVDDGVCARLWSIAHRRDALDDYDGPESDDAFPIGEHDDIGYFFIRLAEPGAPIYFYDYSDPPPITPIARNFESFLRDWLTVDLDLLEVLHNARRRLR